MRKTMKTGTPLSYSIYMQSGKAGRMGSTLWVKKVRKRKNKDEKKCVLKRSNPVVQLFLQKKTYSFK